MVHCAKCGAELIGSRKFCAACGTPAGDPRSPAASTGQAPVASSRAPAAPAAPGSAPGSGPAIQYAPAPTSRVNPFAQTAGPANTVRASDYGPPPASIPPEFGTTTPGVGAPSAAPQVSPLAISNVMSQRGAFENAITAGPEEAAAAAVGLFPVVPPQPPSDPAQSSKRGAVPGTQLMPSIANPPTQGDAPGAAPAGSGPPAPVAKRPDRTQLLGAIPAGMIPRPGAPAPASVAHSAAAPSGAAHSGVAPSGGAASGPAAAPGSGPSLPQAPAMQQPAMQQQQQQPPPPPQSAYQPPPQPQPPQPPPPAWNPAAPSYPQTPQAMQPQPVPMPYAAAPPPPAAPYAQQPQATQPPQPQLPPQAQPGYVFGYPPGSRVTVTWSNGQRYPGTVQQVSGSQCLVVFPDGQHHWVEMQYVAPA
jgi:hypothetical protein